MPKIKHNPESGKALKYEGPNHDTGYDIILEACLQRGAGIIVYVLDNYNQHSGWSKYFPDTKDGYAEAKAYFDRLATYGWNLPVKCRNPETLPEGMFY